MSKRRLLAYIYTYLRDSILYNFNNIISKVSRVIIIYISKYFIDIIFILAYLLVYNLVFINTRKSSIINYSIVKYYNNLIMF